MLFNELGNIQNDNTVPMSNLYDIAIKTIYGNVDLSSFVSCTIDDDNKWTFFTYDYNDIKLELNIYNNLKIEFLANNIVVNFDTTFVYNKLIEYLNIK